MEKKVSTEKAVSVGSITIVPVVEVHIGCWRVNGSLFFFGAKQPWALLIITDGEKKAFNLAGEEMPLGGVLAKLPGLEV